MSAPTWVLCTNSTSKFVQKNILKKMHFFFVLAQDRDVLGAHDNFSVVKMREWRAAISGALAAAAVSGALASRGDPTRSLLGFAAGAWMKAPAESELELVQVPPRRAPRRISSHANSHIGARTA